MARRLRKSHVTDSTATSAAADFVRAMFEPRPDPYEGADLATSRRVTAAFLGLSSLLSLTFLPFEPPDQEIGPEGWLVGPAIVAAGLIGTFLLLRRQPGFNGLLVVAYGGVAGIAALNWLAGGDSSAYEDLFVLFLGAGAVHPPRRAFTHLGVLIGFLSLPLLYEGTGTDVVTDWAAEVLLLLAIGSVLTSYLFYVRRQRAGLQAGAEVARRLARSDALTGLGNRRALDDMLTGETARSTREGVPLAIGLVDLDGLRRINDRYGHLEGDRCLREAARAMEESVRGSDMCFRWGGDEFVVVLPGTDRNGAEGVLARMAESVGRVCASNDDVGLSLTYGVAELTPGESAEDLLALADLALMEQKTEKRR
jgi:two-component system, sensor histidine kinase LadS